MEIWALEFLEKDYIDDYVSVFHGTVDTSATTWFILIM